MERRRTLNVPRGEQTRQVRIRGQAEFARPQVVPEDSESESLVNEYLNSGPEDTRYLTIIPCPHVPGHHHNNIPCMAIAVGCSAAGLNALQPEAIPTQLNVNAEGNTSSPAASNTNQVKVE